MLDPDTHQIVKRLESTFNYIFKERMADVPITNDKIEVRAIAFQRWQESYLGVMITPWFMNLMLLPGKSENWDDKQELSTNTYTFPSGNYQFLTGFEPDIGKYQMCSLFSPMFVFSDNNAAIETAETVMKELMNTENIEEAEIKTQQIENIWNGIEETSDELTVNLNEQGKVEATPTLSEKMEKPISRRSLLRGTLMLKDDE